jgi:hypothetical protein
MNRLRICTLILGCLIGLGGCCSTPASEAAPPVPGHVTDVGAFEQFIATQPTPDQFKRRYPDVVLVLPGQMATKELRLNRSRYFAEVDAQGRIRGGKFQ